MQNPTRPEAERLLGISEKLLQNRDLVGSRELAILAQEIEPLLEGSDQILAIIDVLIASEKHVNNHPDWYAVLQVGHRSDNIDLIKRQYCRLALLLHPDKCRFHFAEHAFKLVADAWALLSDPIKKSIYDKEFSFLSRVDLSVPGVVQREKLEKLPARRAGHRPASGSNLTVDNQGFDPRTMSSSAAGDKIAEEENSQRSLSIPGLVQREKLEKLPVRRAGHRPTSGSNLTVDNQGFDPRIMSSSVVRDKIAAEENSRRSLSVLGLVQREKLEKLPVRRAGHIPASGSNLTVDNQGFDPRIMSSSIARDKITAEENSQRSLSVLGLVQREKLEKLPIRRAGHIPAFGSNLTVDNQGFDSRTMSSSASRDKIVAEENSQRSLSIPSLVQREKLEKLPVRRAGHIPASGSNLTVDNQGFDPRIMSSSVANDKTAAEENSRRSLSVPSLVQREKLEKLPVRRAGHRLASGSNLTVNNQGFDPQTMFSSAERDKIAAEENSQKRSASMTFWTACPYCYYLYEYPKAYEDCCLRCQNCKRSFHGVAILTLPSLVPGQDAYYCCWGLFPLGFAVRNAGSSEKEDDVPVETMPEHAPGLVPALPMMHTTSSLPNWMHVPSTNNMSNREPTLVVPMPTQMSKVAGVPNEVASISGSRKRGSPGKHPVAF